MNHADWQIRIKCLYCEKTKNVAAFSNSRVQSLQYNPATSVCLADKCLECIHEPDEKECDWCGETKAREKYSKIEFKEDEPVCCKSPVPASY